ncbi:hypothetical protein CATYP_10170 [Corynebacterium atypicum]|uniref:PspA/IM30 family protein n=1 Tax=Corynebacterium atypicum TaxID=191610 RepID=A0ABN4DEK4_9CORY|nr:PspA/IM30 family protein [Corynebacterium atypicum]AIG64849.1 hypothetical protein CATYP_10170 [Corynebacterium atypicum]
MANPLSKGWKYLLSSLDAKIDENADPRVQIKQAADEARRQHQEISAQAARVIGNEKQLSIKLDRLRQERDTREEQTRQALRQADAAQAQDQRKATELGNAAEILATQLVAVEQELEQATENYRQAAAAAEEAKKQQQQSEAKLAEQLSQIDELSRQIDQTAMQEASAGAAAGLPSAPEEDSVPTLDSIRDKIERRYAEALGRQELAGTAAQQQMAQFASAAGDMRAASRLEEIRAELRGGAEAAELNAGGAGAAKSHAAEAVDVTEVAEPAEAAERETGDDDAGRG